MKCHKTEIGSRYSAQSGFSLLEALITVSILMVAAGIFVPKVNSAIKDGVVANAYDSVLMAVRQGREAAVSERRVYVVTFTSPGTVTVAPLTAATNALNFSRSFPAEVQFTAITGIPNTVSTTPDGLGTGPSTGAICFDVGVTSSGTNTVYFWPDGSSRDANGNMNSGVVYLARRGELMSSRAITVWGISGRIRGWRLIKNAAGVTSWRQQ
jgi:Tfp pilus assembly protein FimT